MRNDGATGPLEVAPAALSRRARLCLPGVGRGAERGDDRRDAVADSPGSEAAANRSASPTASPSDADRQGDPHRRALRLDERKIAEVVLKVSGYIEDLFVDYTGKPVRKGEPLFSIYSPDLVSAEQEYLLAVQTQKALGESQVPSVTEVGRFARSGEPRTSAALGPERAQVRSARGSRQTGASPRRSISPRRASSSRRWRVAGQSVQPGMPLYKIADLSTIWVYGDIYEYELPLVKVGPSGGDPSARTRPTAHFTARVAYVSPTLDPKTPHCQGPLRAEEHRPTLLRPEMYGTVELRVRSANASSFPRPRFSTRAGARSSSSTAATAASFRATSKLGDRVDDYVEIDDGLSARRAVVTSGTSSSIRRASCKARKA